eukprot:COSAG03_NODE_8496_length_797_cov_0.951289_1_plen_64_part_10
MKKNMEALRKNAEATRKEADKYKGWLEGIREENRMCKVRGTPINWRACTSTVVCRSHAALPVLT